MMKHLLVVGLLSFMLASGVRDVSKSKKLIVESDAIVQQVVKINASVERLLRASAENNSISIQNADARSSEANARSQVGTTITTTAIFKVEQDGPLAFLKSLRSSNSSEAGNSAGKVCCWGPPSRKQPKMTPFKKKVHCHHGRHNFYHMYKAPNVCCDKQDASGHLASSAPRICFAYDWQEPFPDTDRDPKYVTNRFEMNPERWDLEEVDIVRITAQEIIQRIENNEKGYQVPDEATFRTFLLAQNEVNKNPKNLQAIRNQQDGFVFIIGDIHGQLNQLLYVMEKIANITRDSFTTVNSSKFLKCQEGLHYVFLGDYVDRGDQDLEVVALLLAYRAWCPSSRTHGVLLLRGNHEDLQMNEDYGFYKNYKTQYLEKDIELMEEAWSTLPFAAILNNETLLVHGGLPMDNSPKGNFSELNSLAEFESYVNALPSTKTCSLPGQEPPVVCDMLWSDPEMDLQDLWDHSPRGMGFLFGKKAIQKLIDHTGIQLIIRGHQQPINGRGYYGQFRILTVFTVANYCNRRSYGAFVEIKNGNHLQPYFYEHQVNPSGQVVSDGEVPWTSVKSSLSLLQTSLKHDVPLRKTLSDIINDLQLSSLPLSKGCEVLAQDGHVQKAVQAALAMIKDHDGGNFAQRAVIEADEIGDAALMIRGDRRNLLICFSEALLEALEGETGVATADRYGANIAEADKKRLLAGLW